MRPGVSTRFLFLPASVLVIVAVIALSFSAHAHADSVALYATSCLGGWENPTYATGMPDVRDVDASVLFSESNSAVLRPNTQTQLYCGGFTGDVIENTVPVDIRVTFSWNAEFPADVSSKPAASESVPESVLPSVETAPDTVPEVAPTTELVPEATSTEPIDESAPASDVVSEPGSASVPETVPESAPEPTSWLWRVLGTVVFAQEVSGGEQENTEAISETVSNEELTDVPAPALIEENTTVTADDTVSTEVAAYGIVEVLYTLNGVEWKSLGYVRKNDFYKTQFEIPITEASDWEDISRIQIGIQTVPTTNQVDPTIFLDSVWLEVEYESPWSTDDALHPPQFDKGDVSIASIVTDDFTLWYIAREVIPVSEEPMTLDAVPETSTATEAVVQSETQESKTQESSAEIPATRLYTPEAFAPFVRELWIEYPQDSWVRIAQDDTIALDPHIAIADGQIFWLGQDALDIWRFDPTTGGYESASISPDEPQTLLFHDRAGALREAVENNASGTIEFKDILSGDGSTHELFQ